MARAYVNEIRAQVRRLAFRYAAEIEAWMKENAPWTDRTSNARQTLQSEATQLTLDMAEIQLWHGVDYGIWLELANSGRYAVLAPALDLFGPRIWEDVRFIVGG